MPHHHSSKNFYVPINNLNKLFILLNAESDDPNYLVLGGTALGAAALTYYMTKKDAPIDPLYDFDNQSIEIDVLLNKLRPKYQFNKSFALIYRKRSTLEYTIP